MRILAIDPGPTQSAFVIWDGANVTDKGIVPNEEARGVLNYWRDQGGVIVLAIEMIGHYGSGMPAGRDVFDTCIEIGRFWQVWGAQPEFLLRATIKTHLCGSAKAKDANVSQALKDRFGKPGTKKAPGVLYGVSSHCWAALAVAVCAHDRLKTERAA